MKSIFKILSLSLAVFAFAACSDDEPINSNDATVCMGEAEYSVKENKGIFTIPVVAEGERNGSILITVEVKDFDQSCVENKNYIVTSKSIIMPKEKNTVNVEIMAVDDRELNEDRKFSVSITAAKGAKVGGQNTTLVTLLDNDNIPYDRMGGIWTVTAVNELSEKPETVSWDMQLVTAIDESEPGYGKTITMVDWRTWDGEVYDFLSHTASFNYNERTQTATLDLTMGEVMADSLSFGTSPELMYCSVRSAIPTQTSFSFNGTVVGTVNEDFTKVVFNLPLLGIVQDSNARPYSYMFWYSDIVMTKKE